jgi:hypothetical protein
MIKETIPMIPKSPSSSLYHHICALPTGFAKYWRLMALALYKSAYILANFIH